MNKDSIFYHHVVGDGVAAGISQVNAIIVLRDRVFFNDITARRRTKVDAVVIVRDHVIVYGVAVGMIKQEDTV
ncbi:unnamed protein product [marine sediment metagenome]|uniref:Uncharacterized protein n=1 Tax=marine sediment metagenome TaxID=412755 RepID=X0TMU8_9ZZZZ